ncbi:hypothetical protein QWI49_12095 [Acinetobacter nosocomialis]|uniref:hypothetical protein n=1 Tax=Acinetobacter nosocomialis TaxID=106654 RepID=UPI0027415448|nr:hypothetical protein [Acinetobacter nosocomialis]MDP7775888.1 hypothetical protein [Acinetobacter nosocomialis]
MDDRNLELEAWLIEAAGEEMMANHLGPNWNKFNEEFGFYPNMAMTVADLVWQHQQAKVEELQRRNQMLNDNIKEQGQKLVYQNEVIETQAEKLLGLRDEKAELQKRVDAAKQLIEDLNKCYQQDHQNKFEYWRGFADSAGILGKRLEQALKGER